MVHTLVYWCNLYEKYKKDALCLDIEMTSYNKEISLVGLFKPKDGPIDYQAYIKDENLTATSLKEAFKGCKLLITYNGCSFDVPMIRKQFPGVLPSKIPVMDLYLFAKKLDLNTNLKVLENTLGIDRLDKFTKNRNIAAKLWNKYKRRNDIKALNTLLEYNKQDTINLYPIAEEFVKLVKKKVSEK